jgi:hypothetical protein
VSERPVCIVCRRPLSHADDYLVRLRAGRQTAVHRHVCFPPRDERRRPVRRAA